MLKGIDVVLASQNSSPKGFVLGFLFKGSVVSQCNMSWGFEFNVPLLSIGTPFFFVFIQVKIPICPSNGKSDGGGKGNLVILPE